MEPNRPTDGLWIWGWNGKEGRGRQLLTAVHKGIHEESFPGRDVNWIWISCAIDPHLGDEDAGLISASVETDAQDSNRFDAWAGDDHVTLRDLEQFGRKHNTGAPTITSREHPARDRNDRPYACPDGRHDRGPCRPSGGCWHSGGE